MQPISHRSFATSNLHGLAQIGTIVNAQLQIETQNVTRPAVRRPPRVERFVSPMSLFFNYKIGFSHSGMKFATSALKIENSTEFRTYSMTKDVTKLLMVEDSESLSAIYESYLENESFEFAIAANLREARKLWLSFEPDLVLLDVELPDGNGLDLLESLPQTGCVAADVVVMTAYGSTEMAVRSVRQGAFDYLSKPFDADRLRVTLQNALDRRRLRSEVARFADLNRDKYGDFIESSPAMQSIYRIIDSISDSDATAFVTGESGTGKEVTAQTIHGRSTRAHKTFHAMNCAAIPEDLMESELFGHVKGAFTGAISHRDGAATVSDGGTLFLDEICEMSLDLQKKMLRFIQTGEYQRIGSNKVERADIRFICATNRDPLEEVRSGRFREDLYYRLHVVPISLPPLRDRGDDILALAEHQLRVCVEKENKRFKSFTEQAKQMLMTYAWPGNVRELENVIQNAVVLNNGEMIEAGMLFLRTLTEPDLEIGRQPEAVTQISPRLEIEPLWLVERKAIETALKLCSNNVNRAAGLLEVSPSTIYRKIQSWEKQDSQE